MKYFLILLAVLPSLLVKSQTKPYDNSLLNTSIEAKEFQEWLRICKTPNDTLPIVDTANFFSGCDISYVCTRPVKLLHKVYNAKNKLNIFLFRVDLNKNTYKLYFVNSASGRDIDLTFLKKGTKIKLIKVENGDF
jgi:hypothetical protein